MTSVLNNVPVRAAYDFGQKVEQLRGKTFLEAFNSLRAAVRLPTLKAARLKTRLRGSAQPEREVVPRGS